MKKMCCVMLMFLILLCQAWALASPRAEESFRFGWGGKDAATSAPLVLPDGNLVVAVSTHANLGKRPFKPEAEQKTWLACVDQDAKALWEITLPGHYSLCDLDAEGNVRAFGYFAEADEAFVQLNTFYAETGELIAQKQAMKLVQTEFGDNPTLYSCALPDYLWIEERHDVNETDQPRYYRLQALDGSELWKKKQRDLLIRDLSRMEQMEDGILLMGSSREMEEKEGTYPPIVMKVSFSGEVLWYYIPQRMEQGRMLHHQRSKDGDLVVFGFARTDTMTGKESTWHVIASLNAQTGEVLWEKIHPQNAQLTTRVDGAVATSDGYLTVTTSWEPRGIVCVLYDEQGAMKDTWLVSTPGVTRYSNFIPFMWQEELWIQATADNDYRWDAHYQRIEKDE